MTTAAPAIAGRVGTYQEFLPDPALRPHFQCVWAHAIPVGHGGPVAVLPDGCVDLLWMGDRLVVAGPDVSAAISALPAGRTVTGARFQPGAAACWLGVPLSELVGLRIDLADLWGAKARDLADRLAEPDSAASIAVRLQSALACQIPGVALPPPDIEAIFGWIRQGAGASGPHMAAIRDRLAVSERSLRRRCHRFFGYGPKTLERILRFQHLLQAMRSSHHAGLSALACDAGYADQAHLSREARSLTGMSAGTILRQLSG